MLNRTGVLTPASRARLTDAGTARESAFTIRLERWLPDLMDGLAPYRGRCGPDLTSLATRVVDRVADAFADRPPALADRDEERLLRPDWFAGPDQIGYVCYPDRFAGTLAGVAERIGYLRELGVTYLHLMPLLRPRDGADDGGYAVADYRQVRPDLGTMQDLARLADALHESGISLTLDLVLNHVAREHPWAVAARAGDARYRGYFHVFADRDLPDAYEQALPEVFPYSAPGNFSWDPDLGWVWTTFHDYQWDLNWSNPEVFLELLEIILLLANVGVDCLRLDAIAFIWKQLGTSCQNRPEVHQLVQALRAAVRIAAPSVIFKAEAIVAPEELPAYLGTGSHAGKVCDLAYHNSLMVQLWSALASRSAGLARHALAVPPPKPVTTAWGTYLRCHDDIGWAISDTDAGRAGLSGAAHRSFLADFYAGRFPGSFARGADFQVDPVTGDRRTCGTLASLAGLEAGLERLRRTGDPRGVDQALARIFLLHAVIYGYGGIPLLYMGDELGLCNDGGYRDDPRLAGDNRWMHRPAMPWQAAARRDDPSTVEGRIHAGLAHLARVRAGLASLHAAVESSPVDAGNDAVLGLIRRHPAGAMLQLYNVSPDWQHVPVAALPGPSWRWEHISGFAPVAEPRPGGPIHALPPYAAWWLTVAAEPRPG